MESLQYTVRGRFGAAVRFRLEDVERQIRQKMLTEAEANAEE